MTNNKKKDDIMKLDLYKLLEIAEDVTPKQIKKAYRAKALKCHPDKNPDNPKAAETFHQLSQALEILSDVGARAAYDHVLRARRAAKERTQQLDAKRRKVKEDLEAREQAADQIEKKQAKTNLKHEIERLRDEGSRILEEEQRYMREQMKKEESTLIHNDQPKEPARLKLKWRSLKEDENNGGYNEDMLKKMFSKYCNVNGLILSKKKGSAIIELADAKAAELAKSVELGLPSNQLRISWLSGKPNTAPPSELPKHFSDPPGGMGGATASYKLCGFCDVYCQFISLCNVYSRTILICTEI
uniref:dnaJ homolog subfamily C member 17 isoform X2 n=1 Tax=Ciona intestinalis TaxID=7719 RepID=UPI000EF4BD09|nr:dnaJ homolog subfamily C member 17 isoform X2 [Ciona intestinalis]|eukprot:XP_026694791.1 dnaJ homolog subfamily C member 17 isoform X2 [Ciona intestinalis]